MLIICMQLGAQSMPVGYCLTAVLMPCGLDALLVLASFRGTGTAEDAAPLPHTCSSEQISGPVYTLHSSYHSMSVLHADLHQNCVQRSSSLCANSIMQHSLHLLNKIEVQRELYAGYSVKIRSNTRSVLQGQLLRNALNHEHLPGLYPSVLQSQRFLQSSLGV